jgi:hypothetical protein
MNKIKLPELNKIKLPELNPVTLWIGVFLVLVGYWIVVNLAM